MTVSIVLDLDGTLLHEHQALPGARQTVQTWADRGHRICYATNDAVLTLEEQRARLDAAGLPLADLHGPTPMATAATVTASHVRLAYGGPRLPRVLLVGAPAVATALGDHAELVDERPDVVVVGLDLTLTYQRLAAAVNAVDRGALLLATNSDPWYVAADGRRRPGAGSLVAAVERTTGVEARVLGKPARTLYDAVLEHADDEVVVIGDSATDLMAGRALGAICLAVGAAAGHSLADASAPGIAGLVDHVALRVEDEEAIA